MDRATPRKIRPSRNPSGTAQTTSTLYAPSSSNKPSDIHSAESADFRRWVSRSQTSSSGLGGAGFLSCCPCRVQLDGRACTPQWCFSYRYLDWLLTVIVILVASWSAFLFSFGAGSVGPGSPLFAIGMVVLAAYAAGHAGYYHLNLPPTVGMLTVGLVYRNMPLSWDATDHLQPGVISTIKSLLFTISAVKAGLYFDGAVFHNFGLTIILIGVVPCVLEALAVSLAAQLLFHMSAMWAFTLGFIWGGVSPVLISMCVVSLVKQGYGAKTGIVSILLAASTVDNNLVIVIFEIFNETLQHTSSDIAFVRIVVKLLLSISSGCFLGFLLASLPNRYSRHALLTRSALLILTLCCVHLGCRLHKLDAAAFICNVTMASFMVNCWRVMGWQEDANSLREAFEMLWHFCHPIAMVLVGMSADFSAMNKETVWKVVVIYVVGLSVRAPVTYVLSAFSRKPWTQRLFISFSYWSKGILQTTLGALVLENIHDDPGLTEKISTSVSLVVIIGTYVVAVATKFLGPLLLPKVE